MKKNTPGRGATTLTRGLLNKVPEVTLFFWVIKILCTTVGETASDFLNVNLGLGLLGTSAVMGILLAVVLFFQVRAKKYIPWLYWLAVVLISIFGTLITDNLTDRLGVPLETSTVIFSILLVIAFAIWYFNEKTLSIHSIFTQKREIFYWSTILVTFALGTAAGDLLAESLGLSYLVTGLIVCATIAIIIIAWRFKMDAILAFWLVYILTRPLGASLGDLISQSPANGGLGIDTSIVTAVFFVAIIAIVAYLSITKRDVSATTAAEATEEKPSNNVHWQVTAVFVVLVLVAGPGYYIRRTQLQQQAAASSSATMPLGDLSAFKKIVGDTLTLVNAGNLPAATTRIADLETAWDNGQAQLKPMNQEKWTVLDGEIDTVLRDLRAVNPSAAACKTSLEALMNELNTLDPQK